MPFVRVYGLPNMKWYGDEKTLKSGIVDCLTTDMNVPRGWVRAFLIPDLSDVQTKGEYVPEPLIGSESVTQEGVQLPSEEEVCETIVVYVDTGLLHGRTNGKVVEILTSLGQVISDFFEGKYEVELFVNEVDPNRKALIHAKPKE